MQHNNYNWSSFRDFLHARGLGILSRLIDNYLLGTQHAIRIIVTELRM